MEKTVICVGADVRFLVVPPQLKTVSNLLVGRLHQAGARARVGIWEAVVTTGGWMFI